jgi:hypothetical protein
MFDYETQTSADPRQDMLVYAQERIRDTAELICDELSDPALQTELDQVLAGIPEARATSLEGGRDKAIERTIAWNTAEGQALIPGTHILTAYKDRFARTINEVEALATEQLIGMRGADSRIKGEVKQRVRMHAEKRVIAGQAEFETIALPENKLDKDGNLPPEVQAEVDLDNDLAFMSTVANKLSRLERILGSPVKRKIGTLLTGKTVEGGEYIFRSPSAQLKEFKTALTELNEWLDIGGFSGDDENFRFSPFKYGLAIMEFFQALDVRDRIAEDVLHGFDKRFVGQIMGEVSAFLRGEPYPDMETAGQNSEPTTNWTDPSSIRFDNQQVVQAIESEIAALLSKGFPDKKIERQLRKKYHPDSNGAGAGDDYIRYLNLRFTFVENTSN